MIRFDMLAVLRRFSRLHWKLVISYVFVTLVTVLVLEIVLILGIDWLNRGGLDRFLGSTGLKASREMATRLVEPLAGESRQEIEDVLASADRVVFRLELEETDTSEGLEGSTAPATTGTRVVVNAGGHVVASDSPEAFFPGSPFSDPGHPEAARFVGEALTDGRQISFNDDGNRTFVAIVPIVDAAGKILGALYDRRPNVAGPLFVASSREQFRSLGGSIIKGTLLLLLPFTVVLGTIFGFLTTRPFAGRLRRLTDGINALAEGDLSQRVKDNSGDEVGQLARQFNSMAEQIESDTARLRELAERNERLANETQMLAALEERHYLARELHDGLKQQLFAIKLTTASALNLIEQKPGAAAEKLREIEELGRQAQAEMDQLLNELRPVSLEERGLVAALDEHIAAWSRRHEVEVDWHADDEPGLPMTHAQALFRFVQESLANVARHAGATRAGVALKLDTDRVEVCVTDNGSGFDPADVDETTSMGLRGMRDRLTRLEGELSIETALGAGTTLVAMLPLTAVDSEVQSND